MCMVEHACYIGNMFPENNFNALSMYGHRCHIGNVFQENSFNVLKENAD